jgi:hypothetical protein
MGAFYAALNRKLPGVPDPGVIGVPTKVAAWRATARLRESALVRVEA